MIMISSGTLPHARKVAFLRVPILGDSRRKICIRKLTNEWYPPLHALVQIFTMALPEDLAELPPTLLEWRSPVLSSAYQTWEPLTPWFVTQGIELFKNRSGIHWSPYVCPSTDVPRAHDGNYIVNAEAPPPGYPNLVSIVNAAKSHAAADAYYDSVDDAYTWEVISRWPLHPNSPLSQRRSRPR